MHNILVRQANNSDLDRVLELNRAVEEATSTLTIAELEQLHQKVVDPELLVVRRE